MITFIFRKNLPTIFSIEKLFDTLYERLQVSGVALQRLELPHVSTGIASVWRNMRFVRRRCRTRVVHITGDVHYATLLCAATDTVITVHDCVVMQRGTGFKRWVMQVLWFSLPMRRAAAVVAISEQTKRELLRIVPGCAAKITVIPNFVDPAFAFKERTFATERPRILHVGTTPNKNLFRVVAALRGIPCCLCIVGELSPKARRELEQCKVQYENVARVDHETIVRLYEEADIVSFPSTYEGFGMPILEGQAAGRPVLTSDLEPMRSVAGPGGARLCDPLSVESIRDGFVALIGDAQLRARLVGAGLENSVAYSLDSVAQRYLDLYRGLGASVE